MAISENLSLERLRIRVYGIVQGVGFRPFVYKEAVALELAGFVCNDANGVIIEAEGPKERLETLTKRLVSHAPLLARIDHIETKKIAKRGEKRFQICKTLQGGVCHTAISPDIAVCDACLAQMRNPADRRYEYYLINCTDCGPRYTITTSIPYDRPNTSMASFKMCKECAHEYADWLDRRYHAQPISCFSCGPQLTLYNGKLRPLAIKAAAIDRCAAIIQEGGIVALKGLGGFHLMCDATNEEAVVLLRLRKQRAHKPFAVMFPDITAIKRHTHLDAAEERLILSKEKPIVLVDKAQDCGIAPSVAPANARLGVFLPYTPLHYLLFDRIKLPLVATSANLSDEPIIQDARELSAKLGHVVDAILDHDRAIINGCDDSVMQVAAGKPITLRMARGFAPRTMKLPFSSPQKILAVGANQKNTIALVQGDTLILSPHIGDLVSLEAFGYFERTIETFKRLYGFEPDLIACDAHLHYESAKWARSQNDKPIIQVQHHYAHILACMAEHRLEGRVLGFAFDGTGYGEDGTIWGGEVLLADNKGYKRLSHLQTFRLIGGEAAVREPRRIALALLFECYSLKEVLALDLATVKAFDSMQIKNLYRMLLNGTNAPLCSSAGRLFDGFASLCGLLQKSSFEGQSGLMMEALYDKTTIEPLPFILDENLIDWRPALRAAVEALQAGATPGTIVSRFMATIMHMIASTAQSFPDYPVVLGGGVFQNRIVTAWLLEHFRHIGHPCYIQHDTPVNDGGIALGQTWAALGHLN